MERRRGYGIASHGDMITDGLRMEAYAAALKVAVQPRSIVLDIGAGTGILSFLACQLGAGHVHAVEPSDAILVAREIAEANHFGDRITFHQKLSSEVSLHTPARVVVSDLRSVLPLFEHHIPAIVDARKRLMAPNGVLIPRADTLWASPVEAPDTYGRFLKPWRDNPLDLDMRAGLARVMNSWRKVHLSHENLLARPRRWVTLDYGTVVESDVSGALSWTTERAGTAHGFLLWFDTELVPKVGFTNRPGERELIYGQAFFPWPEPVKLSLGDKVQVDLRADLVGDDYLWSWNTKMLSGEDGTSVKGRFKQSTFYAEPLSPEKLKKKQPDFVPHLTEDGQVDQLILLLMDGDRALEEIARTLFTRFPHRYRRWEDALNRVAQLSEEFSQ